MPHSGKLYGYCHLAYPFVMILMTGGCSADSGAPLTPLPSDQGPVPNPAPPANTALRLSAVTPALLPSAGGGSITLTGTNFQAGAQVTVGGKVPLRVSVDSPSQITAVLPDSTGLLGQVPIVVQNPDGQVTTGLNLFSYFASHIDFSGHAFFEPGGSSDAGILFDFNGDSLLDFAYLDNSYRFYVYPGPFSFDLFPAPIYLPSGLAPRILAAGDFNADSKPDITFANTKGGSVSLMLGDGRGGFGAATTFPVGSIPVGGVAADFNGDKFLDLAVASSGSSTVSVLLGDGKGGFGLPATFPVDLSPSCVVAADFNGDKILDLAVVSEGTNTLSVLLGNGVGGFGASSLIPIGLGPHALVTADFNGDLRSDLVLTNYSSDSVSVLLGNGRGGFASSGDFPVGSGPSSVDVGDMNGDLKLDLVVVTKTDSTTSVLTGDGGGGFTQSWSARLLQPVGATVLNYGGARLPDILVSKDSGAAWLLGNISK